MQLTRAFLVFAVSTAILGGAAFAGPASVTIPMKALNNSGESGTAVLTAVAGGVQVTVSLKNAPSVPQPTHIHIGTCGNINLAPEYPLLNTVNGKSTTVVKGVKLSDLLAGHYAVNVHKSADDLATYVSCGNIK